MKYLSWRLLLFLLLPWESWCLAVFLSMRSAQCVEPH